MTTKATTDAPLSVHAALVAVMNDVQGLSKERRNTQGGGYNFRGIDDVMNAVGPALRKHGLGIVIDVRSSEYGEILTGAKRTPMGHARVTMQYTLIGPDGSTLTGAAPGEAFDSGDKATAKACSVAYRTFWLQTLCLPTDEPDPDASAHYRATAAAPPSRETAQALLALAPDGSTPIEWVKAQAAAHGYDMQNGAEMDELLDELNDDRLTVETDR